MRVENATQVSKGWFRPELIFWGERGFGHLGKNRGHLCKLQNNQPACCDSFAVQEKEPPERKLSIQSSRKENDQ